MADRLLGLLCTEIIQAYYNVETHTREYIHFLYTLSPLYSLQYLYWMLSIPTNCGPQYNCSKLYPFLALIRVLLYELYIYIYEYNKII